MLPGMADSEADELDGKVRRSACEESRWVAQLEGFAIQDLPQAGSDEVLEDSVLLPSALQEPAAALGLVAAYLCRSFQSDRIDFWVHRDKDEHQGFDDYFLGCVPFSVRPDWESTADDLLETVRHDLEATLKRAPPLADIGLRYPSLQDKLEQIAELPSCEFSLSSESRQDAPRPGARRLMFTMSETEDALGISATGIFEPGTFASFVDRFRIMLENLSKDPESSIAACPTLTNDDRELLKRINDTQTSFNVQTVHTLFREQARVSPDRNAVICGDKLLTYQQLDQESDQVAIALMANSIGPGDLVGVMMSRSAELLTVLMGVIKAGAAYVPLDRNYPPNRLQFVIGDCRPKMIVVDHAPAWSSDAVQMIQYADLLVKPRLNEDCPIFGEPSDLMYVIYTSGSTGKPKGVQVRHENVQNFFVGIDERIGPDAGTLLATTSISFDISVLELFWTLCRGFTVVLHDEDVGGANTRLPDQPIGFSLFFWNVAETEPLEGSPYNLVLQASKYADTNNFEAVWTPERHFGSFGGYYPNPSVISAAIAATTKRVAIRAGSCVLPLHHPVRVAEEWSVVDNLSGGRVGLSMASGWSPNDFVLKPENFANAKDVMFESIEQVRALWRGDSVTFTGPKGAVDVKSLPRPVQQELPIWVTAAGNPETFRQAGEVGAHILTHLLGQNIDKVTEKIEVYRNAWRASGRPGDGHVTVMVHTFVAASEQDAKGICREPMKNYLKSALALIKDAAWQFPTFQKFSAEGERTLDDFFAHADPQDVDGLLEFAFERYYNNNSMMGSVEKCIEFADTLKDAGVDEIGCLIDFGIDESTVMKHLPFLNEVRTASNADEQDTLSVSQAIVRHGVTHLQCTPSRATMVLHEPEAAAALNNLSCLMVGGEPLSKELVHQLQSLTPAPLFNMYGPTETTIWSSVCNITAPDDADLIGTPLANQTAYVLDPRGGIVPPGIVGELAIGGLGVTSGYLGQPALNQDRFIKTPGVDGQPVDVYKTGDLVRLMQDGQLEFLGRSDNQVKVRGFRIELGEIEACMHRLPGVVAAAAVVQHANTPNAVIVGFHVSTTGETLADDLSAELKGQLPDFMIPAHFVAVPQLPYLPNGKLDRRQLEQTQVTREARSDAVPPSTETERALAKIWGSLLNVEVVSKTDNFFELGGHSLLAIQAIDAIEKQMSVRLNPRKILTNSLEQLAQDCASIPQSVQKSRVGAFGRFFGRKS
ncbi:MAG: MupA/Atu3671 family FMN-dependent luciferase-like monooxygenase [Anderseniella sp.]